MIRPQKVPGRSVQNHISVNETIQQSSTNTADITSYLGKCLIINYRQFIVEGILGQGGFAFVFLVRATNQQRYALKRMYVNNQHDLETCQREISLLKELSSHRNIVKYVDSAIQSSSKFSDADDAIYEILLLTEYCSNGALINYFNTITSNERHILRVFADICNAVSACHFRRPEAILHRDIKLENILLDSQGNSILCDFGSAIFLSSSTKNDFQQYQTNLLQLEEDIQRYTTLSYRAPEMIDLHSRLPITLKVDIWAMGCLLYKLMYNRMPFGDSILAIQDGTFVIPDDMAKTYSENVNLFVRYILEIDINKRPDIWQVSYIAYKLLGMDCPISNRCQSKIPDLNNISMPLTDSESRKPRPKSKPSSTNITDGSSSLGTAFNPRERPRGMMTPSKSLINFNQPNPQSSTAAVAVVAPPPPSSSNPTRSGSAAQLKFDDNFSQIPSPAINSINIPNVTITASENEQTITRARPSPAETSGHVFQQQFFPPPVPPRPSSSSNVRFHRRSSTQTITPINNHSSFHNASSVDLSMQGDGFYEELISDDDKSISPKNQKIKSNNHRLLTEEAEKNISSYNETSINDLTTAQSVHIDDEQITNSSFLDNDNPFLHAPFHHFSATKQISLSTFDPNSIVNGKRTSAFSPYQKQEKSSTDVFTNAPFKTKSKAKQRTINDQNKTTMADIESKQQIYSNLSFHNPIVDEYL